MVPNVENGRKPTKRFWTKSEDGQCVVKVLQEGGRAFGDQLGNGIFLEEFSFNDNRFSLMDCFNDRYRSESEVQEIIGKDVEKFNKVECLASRFTRFFHLIYRLKIIHKN